MNTPLQCYADRGCALLSEIETYLTRFLFFAEPAHCLPIALWVIATHLFETFDAFPYIVITAATKQAGKTTLAELMSFASNNGVMTSGATGPALFSRLDISEAERKRGVTPPTLFLDEAERQSSEDASMMRELVNSGYRRGSVIPRFRKAYPAYCPKVFILIGSVNDTLNDRSIVITMRRGRAPVRYSYSTAEPVGRALHDEIGLFLTPEVKEAVRNSYATHAGLPFLESGRDEEIWLPIFALCAVLCPARLDDLKQTCNDLVMEKTAPRQTYTELRSVEGDALTDQYSERLLRDLHALLLENGSLPTAEALEALKALPVSPWRKFRGKGITHHDLGHMLRSYGVIPRNIRFGHWKQNKVQRGYTLNQTQAAIDKLGREVKQ
jgi:hypothetical protein